MVTHNTREYTKLILSKKLFFWRINLAPTRHEAKRSKLVHILL